MKPCKDGINIAHELNKVNLNNFTCDKQCYKCIYWGDNYCQMNIIKGIIQKSNKYLENHKE